MVETAGAFQKLVTLFGDLGSGITQIIANPQVLYGVYFVSFLFGIYALISFLLTNFTPLKENNGKAAKAISFFIAIIATGAIFYGTKGTARTPTELIMLFNGFFGFLIKLAFAAGLLMLCIKAYQARKEKKDVTLAHFWLTIGFFTFSALLLPHFTTDGNFPKDNFGEEFSIFGDILGWINLASFIMLIWYAVKLIGHLFKFGDKSASDYAKYLGGQTADIVTKESQKFFQTQRLNAQLNNNLKLMHDTTNNLGGFVK